MHVKTQSRCLQVQPYKQGDPTDRFGKLSVRIRPLIPSDSLKRIVTSNFRDMRNLMSVVFRLLTMSFCVPKKGQLLFWERKWTKKP